MAKIRHNTGFAMVDALVALLLFALVLLAAIAALIQGMRATHAATLTSHAVDLAADLLEQRRALPEGAAPDALLAAWNDRLQQELPPAARPTAQALAQSLLAGGAGGPP
jgi:Tfp pilus assembly protein PilV